MLKTVLRAVAITCLCAGASEARVTRIEIATVQRVEPDQRGQEAVQPYERLSGRFYGELDPADPKNKLITDLEFAPRNARGKVEYVGTFSLMRPAEGSRRSGVLMYSVVNRGSGAATASPEGHFSVVSGWQGDLVPTAANQTLQVPRATNTDGQKISGPLVIRFLDQRGSTAPLTILRGTPSPYPPLTLDTTRASLVSAVSESAEGIKAGAETIVSTDWAFASCDTTPFPGRPDPAHICLKQGFDPSRLYELQYTVTDPFVLGVGFAATRDLNAFLRYEARDDAGTPNPIAGAVRSAIAEGRSQSGAFLRAFIRLGFNQDERGRMVWDGINPDIAARVIDLNRRFAIPGGDVELYVLGTEAPVWWEDWDDAPRGRGKTGLLDRCRATNSCPKILETFSGAEIWNLRASFMLVGTDAKADIPLPDSVRRYFFPGVTHGGGRGGFRSTITAASGCELPANPAPTAPMRSALLKTFVAWVTTGAAMPPSRYPTIADGTLVQATPAAIGFPAIPGRPSPVMRPLLDYDLGPGFNYVDASGIPSGIPEIKRSLPQRAVKVDADGNELGGIRSPLQSAPLGTYTGWNVAGSGPFKGQSCGIQGGFIPFAARKADRLAAGDPRPSLEERYRSHEDYVRIVSEAAATLVREGYLRQGDADAMLEQAAASDVLR